MNKKILSLLFALVTIISTTILPSANTAFGATTTEYKSSDENYRYTIISSKNKTIELTAYIGTDNEVLIPETIDNYTVTSIGTDFFNINSHVRSLTIPSTVSKISSNFSSKFNEEINVVEDNPYFSSIDGVLYDKSKETLIRCPYNYQVETFVVPDNVKTIGSNAFKTDVYFNSYPKVEYSTMIHIIIPEGVEEIKESAFFYTRFDEIILPDSVTKIGKYAFNDSLVKKVHFGSGVKEIGKQLFISQSGQQTPKLSSITVSPNNHIFSSVDGVLLGNYGKDLVAYPQNKNDIKEYKVPDSVTRIHSCAFQHKYFEVLDLNNVTEIEDYALDNTTIYNIIVPECLNKFYYYVMTTYNVTITVLNPNCILDIEYFTLGNQKFNLTIKGYSDSTAYDLVKNNTNTNVTYSFSSLGPYTESEKPEEPDKPICHQYETTIIEPTCTKQGYTNYVCSICGDTYQDDYKKELGHNIIIDEEVLPSCTKSGLTKGSHCSRCDTIIEQQKILNPLNHTIDNGVVQIQATCTQDGIKLYSCENCDYSYILPIKATGHSYTSKVTKSTFNKAGSNETICKKCNIISSKSTIAKITSVNASKLSLVYTGKNLSKPTITVKDSNNKKLSSDNYDITFISRSNGKAINNIKSIGQYKIKVTLKGNYSGTKYLYFSVKPKNINIKSPTTSKNTVTAKWSKDSSVTGYQIVIATDSKFSKNVKTVNINKKSKASYKFSKLKKGTKYYIKIRSYKSIKVDGKTAKMYSDFSKSKSIKCK